MDKKQWRMNLIIIVVLVAFVMLRSIPKQAKEVDVSQGQFSNAVIEQLTQHIKPEGPLYVSEFSRNNNDAENYAMSLLAQKGDKVQSWFLIYDQKVQKKPCRVYYQSEQAGVSLDGLPEIAEAFGQLERLHPHMGELLTLMADGKTGADLPFFSLRANFNEDGTLLVEQTGSATQKEEPTDPGKRVPADQAATLEGVRYFEYDGQIREANLAQATVDRNTFLVYHSEIDSENNQTDRLVALVNLK